jgi:hypothetical protein
MKRWFHSKMHALCIRPASSSSGSGKQGSSGTKNTASSVIETFKKSHQTICNVLVISYEVSIFPNICGCARAYAKYFIEFAFKDPIFSYQSFVFSRRIYSLFILIPIHHSIDLSVSDNSSCFANMLRRLIALLV